MMESKRNTLTTLLPFLVRVISLRDPHARSHSDHVTELAFDLGQAADLKEKELDLLKFAASIHDIGKIAINEFVISKPGKFTEAEYIMVQQHARIGASLVETLGVDPSIHSIILNHHENFDGTGYPNGIAGNEIPFSARIIRIADTYDALTSNRGYRPAYSHKRSLEIIEHDAQFFDSALLDLFLKKVVRKH
jgi:putative nucleotidyltransferase with HDIG domain